LWLSKNAVVNGNLNFKLFFAFSLASEFSDLDFDNEDYPTESSINSDPCIEQMDHDDINITTMKNRQSKTMFSFNTNS
jgi:hypothetical protein